MRRYAVLAVLVGLIVGVVAAAPAVADRPDGLTGSWVAIDVDGSYWQATFGASGNFNSIDSGTVPCDGYRSRLWGTFEEGEFEDEFVVSFALKCLEGPYEGLVVFESDFSLLYDSANPEEFVQLNDEPYDDVTFCRRPCDPSAP